MHFAAFFAAVAAVSTGVSADQPANRYLGDFRVFGETGCFDKNLGVATILGKDAEPGLCHGFWGSEIRAVRMTNVVSDCSMKSFTDENCSVGKQDMPMGVCRDSQEQWKSWTMECSD